MGHHNWDTSDRRHTLPPGWDHIRARILKRDGYACTVCGHVATEVDHVIPHHAGGSDHDDNLTSLCRTHHAAKSSLEGHDAMRQARAAARRPRLRHPGLM